MAITLIEWAAPTAAERQEREIRAAAARHGTPFRARLAAQVEQVEHTQFMAAHFPQIAAARYAIPGGALGDPTPISKSPSATPATNPPTGNVSRPPQRPPYTPPASMVGPAVPPSSPSVQEIPLGSLPPASTPEEQRARRLGFPIPAAPRAFFTWA